MKFGFDWPSGLREEMLCKWQSNAKFHDHRNSGCLEKNVLKSIYWHGGRLGHVTLTIYINFCSAFPRRLHIKFVFD